MKRIFIFLKCCGVVVVLCLESMTDAVSSADPIPDPPTDPPVGYSTDPSIYSILRVNPMGFNIGDIELDPELKEISLHRGDTSKKGPEAYDTWIYEETLEEEDDYEDGDGLKFSNQEDAYRGFEKWYESNLDPIKGADALTCIVVGGRGSGKSYTLFGPDTHNERGIIPRYLSSRFEVDNGHQNMVSFMLISMYMVNGDSMFDLLNPPAEYALTDHNFTYSDSLGVLSLPTKYLRTETAAHGLQIVHLGLMSASMIALSSEFIFNEVDIVVSMRMFQPEKVVTMTFVEASTMLYLPSSIADSDRFSSQIGKLRSPNACAECGLFGSVSGQSGSKKNLIKAQRAVNSSFLTYLLQDALILGGCPVYPSTLSACLVIGCLRGDNNCFSENKFTLNLIQTLSERFLTIVEEASMAGAGDGNNNEENSSRSVVKDGNLVLGSTDKERPDRDRLSSRAEPRSSRVSGIRTRGNTTISAVDAAAVSPRKGMTLDVLGAKLDQEILMLDTYRQMDLQAQQQLKEFQRSESGTSVEEEKRRNRRIKFYDMKQKFLETIHRHVTVITLTKKMKRHDVKVIANWLRDRGLFGLRLAKEPDVNNPDHKIRQNKLNSQELMQGLDEEVEISNMPWAEHGLPAGPYLVPITPINFSNSYLLLPLPSGHVAVCNSNLNTYHTGKDAGARGQKPLAFPGSKNTKTLLLNSVKVHRKHCMFFRVEDTVKIRPLPDDDNEVAMVEINGVKITEETVLNDLDIVRIGYSVVFVFRIPTDADSAGGTADKNKGGGGGDDTQLHADAAPPSDVRLVASDQWENCFQAANATLMCEVVKGHLEQSNTIQHSEVDRALAEITPTHAMSESQKMTRYVPRKSEVWAVLDRISTFHKALMSEAIQAVLLVNFWAERMKKNVMYVVHLRPRPQQSSSTFVSRQYRGAETGIRVGDKICDLAVNAAVLDRGRRKGRGDSWWWSVTILLQRLSLMRNMYNDFVFKFDRETAILDDAYPPSKDPFLDPSEPELLGVCNIHMDSLFYLMDVRDTVPIVTFKGNTGGLLKFNLRCWIDAVDTIPNYIKIDEECKLTDFVGRKCIMKFYFESLIDINPALSNDIHIVFSFFSHSGQYRTPRHVLRNEKVGDQFPYLNNIVVVEQYVTPEFVQYIQKCSVELEVWGGRIFNKRILAAPEGQKRKKYYLGDPKMALSLTGVRWKHEKLVSVFNIILLSSHQGASSVVTNSISGMSSTAAPLKFDHYSRASSLDNSMVEGEEEEEEEGGIEDPAVLLAKLRE